METTAATKIKEMAAKGSPSQIAGFADIVVEQLHGEKRYDGKQVTLQLARLEQHSQFTPEMNMRSSLPGIGFVKRLYGKMAKAVLGPAFQQQCQYNMEVVSCMWEMLDQIDRSEKQMMDRIKQLEEEKEDLKNRLQSRDM